MASRTNVANRRKAPKSRVPAPAPQESRDSLWARLSIPAVVVVAILVMLSIPLWGYIQQTVLPGREPLAQVRDTTITMDDLVRRIRYERALLDIRQAEPEQYASVPMQAVFDLVDEELIRQGAVAANLEITPEDIADAKVAISRQGVSGETWADVAEANATTKKFEQYLAQQVPPRADQVQVAGFTVATQQEAEAALERLRNGEDLAVLAGELSSSTRYTENGGEIGWVPRGLKGDEFDEAVFATPAGELFGPVDTNEGYFVGQVLAVEEDRLLETPAMRELQSTALQRWLAEQRATDNPVRLFWNSEKYAWANDQVRD